MAGLFADTAAISWAGTFLSQLPISTTPSNGWRSISSSVVIESRLRKIRLEMSKNTSQIDIVFTSSGKPPAAQTPRLTASASCRT